MLREIETGAINMRFMAFIFLVLKKIVMQVTIIFYVIWIHINEVSVRLFRKFFNISSKRPWMRRRELLIIEEILRKNQPRQCLEWGAGYSTLCFPKLIVGEKKWISIEHDQVWSENIKNKINEDGVSIVCIAPNNNVEPDTECYDDYKDYIEYPETLNVKFDYIFIDGRARKECLIKAKSLLSPSGIVILHDANRLIYHSVFDIYKYQVLFTDFRIGDGGCWIGSNSFLNIETLNVSKLNDIWRYSKMISKIVKPL